MIGNLLERQSAQVEMISITVYFKCILAALELMLIAIGGGNNEIITVVRYSSTVNFMQLGFNTVSLCLFTFLLTGNGATYGL